MNQAQLATSIENVCQRAKHTTQLLSRISSEKKCQVLLAMKSHIEKNQQAILDINQEDVAQAKSQQLSEAMLDRMTLSEATLSSMMSSFDSLSDMPDPVGKTLNSWAVESGLRIARISMPIGVIAMIYESRPNVTSDAAALCIKSGNSVILRGGSECANTNKIITECLQLGLLDAGIPKDAIQYIPTQDRAAVDVLLQMDDYVDVIIPRGGKSLIQHIRNHSKIPALSHLEGLCHTYIHKDAALDMALNVIINAKMRRTGICGATETMLIDKDIASSFLPQIIDALIEHACEVRGDHLTQTIDARVKPTSTDDWSTEYLDAIISIKIVDDIDEAITHIEQYATNHTESIITNCDAAAKKFQQSVNSAIVMHNCSTQFADGGEFGMGAEIGIATGKLHARGPVGIEQLTTYKYIVKGNGHLRP